MAPEDDPRLVKGERVYFVSDVHLSQHAPEVFLAFCRFLDRVVPGARALYILGDLFDYWIGPGQARLPGFSEVFDRTRRLREEGTEVYFLPGNRDFLLADDFAAAQGMRVLGDRADALVGERRILVTHGDLLCTRDRAYQRMRRVIRSDLARRIVARTPTGLMLKLSGALRAASGSEVRRKSAYVMEPDYALARRWVEAGEYDALIFGHVHRGEHLVLDLEGRTADVFILGSWEDVPNGVEWDGEGLRLADFRTAI